MAKQTINLGTSPTGAGGDTFRSGSAKLQANDDELYAQFGANAQGVLPGALPVNKGGTGAATAAAARTNLGLGSAATATLTTSNTDNTAGRVMKVGDFGLGSSGWTSFPTMDDAIAISHFGFGDRLFSGYAHPYIAAAGVRSFMLGGYAGELRYATKKENEGITPHYTIKSTKNTTIDSNGFIKNASPIIQLFADKIELNNEAKEQTITFEKLNVGDYLIKGSSGFAQEGWYVETPKDANGNVLFSVIYTTLENGDISVKTYKKKFDFETVSIVADLDNPVDITENRWIDLRLQELPQPEIEMLESIAPPEFQPTGLAEAVATVMESYNDTEQ